MPNSAQIAGINSNCFYPCSSLTLAGLTATRPVDLTIESNTPILPEEPLSTEFLIRFGILLTALLAATVLLYLPGLTGPLIFDDYTNLSPLGDDGGVTSWSTFRNFVFGNGSGPSGRPVSMLSFLIDAQHWPPNLESFKYTNILIHVLSGCLLCWLAIEIFQAMGLTLQRSAMLGLFVSALWLLHPFNGSTTLYIVQRMTQLMTLFGIAALLCYLKGRQIILRDSPKGFALLCLSLFPFALLSVLSKENGALFLVLVIVFELSIFRSYERNSILRKWLLVGIGVPLAVLCTYLLLTFPSALQGYEFRHFGMLERLLTQPRILLGYLGSIFSPLSNGAGLFHDDLKISSSLLQPITTLFSIVALLGLITLAWRCRKPQPMLSLGIAWFFAMHLLESTYLPLELYFEHRNYMSMIGPLICSVWYLHVLLESSLPVLAKRAGLVLAVVTVVSMMWMTWQQARLWGHTGNLYTYWAVSQPESARAQITYADYLFLNGEPELGLERLLHVHELNPAEITTLLHMWNNACEYGLVSPYSVREIGGMEGLEYFHNDINFHLTRFLENILLSKCEPPDFDAVILLFERVNALPLADDRRASFHFLYSDLFVHYRQLNPALIQLRNAFDLNPIPQIPIRQALLSASAGNNSEALIFLERARAADRELSFLLPSFEEEIARIEAGINQRLDNQ